MSKVNRKLEEWRFIAGFPGYEVKGRYLAKEFGVSEGIISAIKHRVTWKHV